MRALPLSPAPPPPIALLVVVEAVERVREWVEEVPMEKGVKAMLVAAVEAPGALPRKEVPPEAME